MLSLAIVSLSPCSFAISSSTGATILHGPHHSAQKSTRTGLSLPSTSSAKVASVTVTVLPAMGVSSSRWESCSLVPTAAGARLCPAPSALVEGLGQPALGVDRGGRAGAGGGDRLPVDVVDHVAAGEDAVDVRAGARVFDLQFALAVENEVAGEQLAARVVTDRDEQAAHVQRLGGAGLDVG